MGFEIGDIVETLQPIRVKVNELDYLTLQNPIRGKVFHQYESTFTGTGWEVRFEIPLAPGVVLEHVHAFQGGVGIKKCDSPESSEG